MEVKPISFEGEKLFLIDQRKLPKDLTVFQCHNYKDVDFAIKEMVVRGAPAIGVVAAYGIVMAAREFKSLSKEKFLENLYEACEVIYNSRPTAVNLQWSVERMKKRIFQVEEKAIEEICEVILKEAVNIDKENHEVHRRITEIGNDIVPHKGRILTHCNTGPLATASVGTALGVIIKAHESKKNIFVYMDETRPRFQGAKLTAWELLQAKVPSTLIVDGAAATLIAEGKVDLILVGADRIALNGDTANKIGTFMLSIIAKEYNIPFYVAAPTSTIDINTHSGKEIIIEERADEEVASIGNERIAAEGAAIYNPAFDVTPWENITGIITEKGIIGKPFMENILSLTGEE